MASNSLFFSFDHPEAVRWPAGVTTTTKTAFKALLPITLFLCIFAMESTASLGANHTSGPLHAIFRLMLGSSVDAHWSYLHHIVRKIGHFSGYGAFSLVCFRGFRMTLRTPEWHACGMQHRLIIHGLAIAATFTVAAMDEIHQAFLPNRTGCFADVLLDTSGAVVLQALVLLAVAARAWGRHGKQSARAQRIASKADLLAGKCTARESLSEIA